MIRFLVRALSVGLPIQLIFLLPALGVRSALGTTALTVLIAALPLFVFEYDEQEDLVRCEGRRSH